MRPVCHRSTLSGNIQIKPSCLSTPQTTISLFQSAKSSESLSDRLKLGDRFDRWRFLQDLLDDFIEEDDIHQVLFSVLEGYPIDKLHKDMDDGSLPTATPEQKEIVSSLLEEWKSSNAIPALTNADALCQIEQLIPDPQEDEDGFKATWDTVCELHGREMVKVNEQEGTARWKAVSIVSRVLLHYEFLTEGVRLPDWS